MTAIQHIEMFVFDTDFSTELCSGLQKPVHTGLVT